MLNQKIINNLNVLYCESVYTNKPENIKPLIYNIIKLIQSETDILFILWFMETYNLKSGIYKILIHYCKKHLD